MRGLVVLILLFATACSSAPRRAQPSGAARPDIYVYPVKREGPGGDLGWVNLSGTGEYLTLEVDAPVEEVWKALIRAYPEVGIELGHIDPRTGLIGNRQINLRRSIGGERASRFLNCGLTGTGARRADEGRLTGRVVTYAEAVTEETSRLHTLIEVSVQMEDGTSTSRQACSSTGMLEERLHRLVQLDLALDR